MHIYVSGIGGSGVGPLALIAKQAGFDVSGSDAADSSSVDYLRQRGLTDIHIGQTAKQIAAAHAKNPIDWLVYSSAIPKTDPDHPELAFAKAHGIRATKRDDFLNHLLDSTGQKMIAIAGTHGKTTTTAMTVWAMQQAGVPCSYVLPAKTEFAEMGHFDPSAKYFVYEADEYDRNFLQYKPALSIITGIAYDHPDVYPTQAEYTKAFQDFLAQSGTAVLWQEDIAKHQLQPREQDLIISEQDDLSGYSLPGRVNRQNAYQVQRALAHAGVASVDATLMNKFPGVSRRFEQIAPNIYTDYAHTPEKINGALQVARETLPILLSRAVSGDGLQESDENQSESYQAYDEQDSQALPQQGAPDNRPGVIVVYEGLHNSRQHFIKDQLATLFDGAKKLYVVPSYRAREDESLEDLTPQRLVEIMQTPTDRVPAALDNDLKNAIQTHAHNGDLILCLSAGGANSLDAWLRKEFSE